LLEKSELRPSLLRIGYGSVSDLQKLEELIPVKLVLSSELTGVLLLEVGADDVGGYEEPAKPHEDAGLARLVVAKQIDLPVECDWDETHKKGGEDEAVPQAY
jgi:hypothetical protein